MRRIAGTLTDLYDDALKETGLTISQYSLLDTLEMIEKANVSNWAKEAGLERSTMVRNIKVLDAHGYLNPADGNGKTYTLSQKGKETLAQARPLWDQIQTQIESVCRIEDLQAIERIAKGIQALK